MTTRYQTSTAGGHIIQPASRQLTDHVTVAMRTALEGRKCWIKARDGEPDERLWAVEFAPGNQPFEVTITPLAWQHPVPFDRPGNPGWVRQVRTIADRLSDHTPEGVSA